MTVHRGTVCPPLEERQAVDFAFWRSGGEGGIRTHGTREGSTVFETARFNRSRTSPHRDFLIFP
jgi:hypothetical protein